MQQIAKSVTLAYRSLPRPHRIMLGSLTLITLAVAVWQPKIHQPQSGYITSQQIELDIEGKQRELLLPEASEPLLDQSLPDDELPQDELDQKVGPDHMQEYIISAGDTLGSILTQYGIDLGDVTLLSKQNRELRKLKIGQQLSWTRNENGDLQTLTWVASRRETRVYERLEGKFVEKVLKAEGEWRDAVVRGTLNGSFVTSARAAGLSNAEIHAVTKALQWQMDFRKLRKGDKFSALFARESLEGKVEQSQLVAVRINSGGKDYYAVRAEDGKFYDHNGSGLAQGFLRVPTMKHFRTTSHFNPRRFHPITKRIAPHNGVDFAMPVGTPILSVGDGEVVIAKHSGAAGNYVVIRHGRQYTTHFMHLKKILVKPGQKVKRGERIALSGNTGRSTGPHLHYEFRVNQQPVNPLTVKLPRSDALTGKERAEFLALVKQVKPQLQVD